MPGAGIQDTSSDFFIECLVPTRLRGFRPKDSKSEEWSKFYEGIKSKVASGCIFGICGIRGCGKSQLACCILGHTKTKLKKSAEYWKAQDIFLTIREAMNTKGDSERKAIDGFVKPFSLVIDAYEVRSDSDFENRMMDHIIDKRYDDMKTTIIVSNDTVQSFSKFLGPSTVDRMAQTGGIVELKNKSFRRQ
jgi:DNA replication protein DnaC